MTVQELIDELDRLDSQARVGVRIKQPGGDAIEFEVSRVVEDHSGSKIEVLVVGE